MAYFDAAERLLSIAGEADDRYPPISKSVRIFGGIIPASTLVVEGKPPATVEVSEWFYRSREDIERDYTVQTEKAMPAGERLVIEDHFADLRKECTRQLRAAARSVPKAQREAKRNLDAAHEAEQRILGYKPANLSEAVTLIEYVSKGKRRSCFTTDENDLHAIMLNVASVIKREIAS